MTAEQAAAMADRAGFTAEAPPRFDVPDPAKPFENAPIEALANRLVALALSPDTAPSVARGAILDILDDVRGYRNPKNHFEAIVNNIEQINAAIAFSATARLSHQGVTVDAEVVPNGEAAGVSEVPNGEPLQGEPLGGPEPLQLGGPPSEPLTDSQYVRERLLERLRKA